MTNIHPTIAPALAAFRKAHPISASTPTHDYSDKYTFHLDLEDMRDIDNALQNLEYNHMKQGEQLRRVRDMVNRLIMPGRVR
jgi:hypothetical protein